MKRFIPSLVFILIILHSFCQEWYKTDNLLASNGGEVDWFAYDTDISANFAIVGAPYNDVGSNEDQGTAYVYFYDGNSWGNEQILTASDGASGDEFGRSVAIDGDFLVVGAMFKNYNSKEQIGAAYVFWFDGSSWVEQQKIAPSNGVSNDWFGGAADIQDTVIVIGAHTKDVMNAANAGSVYIYYYNGSTWYQAQDFHASDYGTHSYFGISLDLNGNDLIIGSSGDDIGSNDYQGSAYVFKYAGSWAEVQKLTASDGGEGDDFGRSVGISGNTILVGSPESEVNNIDEQGAVYYYNYLSGNWTQTQKLSAPNSSPWPSFGIDLAIQGDTAIIGAEGQTVGDNMFQGAAFIYTRNGSTWVEDQYLLASDGEEDDYFGNSVSFKNDYAIVGAYRTTIGSHSMQGSAYIFKYGTSSIKENTILANVSIFPNPTTGSIFIESQQNLKLEVYNAISECVIVYDRAPDNINISNQPNGLYLFKFRAENGILVEKIFLQK